MKRKYISHLQAWLGRKKRKPLVLRGARQVGKSTLVQLFAKEVGLDLVEINLELYRALDRVFEGCDVDLIIKNIEGIVGGQVGTGQLLFLDEIQATPHALGALRYFFEKYPELPVIAAGSLLEFTLSNHSFSMPVGRIEYLHIDPMSFSEYLEAVDPYCAEQLGDLRLDQPIADTLHVRFQKHQRNYTLVGGMPEAVDMYRETSSFEDVFRVQNHICSTYMDDFSKYAQEKNLADLQTMFRRLPANVGKKIKYNSLLLEQNSAQGRKLFELLLNAKIVSAVTHSSCNGPPLGAEINPKMIKPLFLDIGLVSRLLNLDWRDLNDVNEVDLIHGGLLSEQFVGQHLQWEPETFTDRYYWTRESKNNNAELDYVVARGQWIIPIEVKSGKAGSMKSLHQFMFDKGLRVAFRFDHLAPSHQLIKTKVTTKHRIDEVEYELYSCPHYAIERLPDFIDKLKGCGAKI